MSDTKRKAVLLATASLAATLIAQPAYSQSAAPMNEEPATATPTDSDAPGDVIVVTAQKRSERLSDVPVSITAATGEQLAARGIDDVADLERIAPGFTYRQSQYGTPVFSIRGIGFYDEQVAASPTVTVYIDQAPIPYARMTEGASLDIERVEVLKGPQGTLFGQNSTGGAVNYIAAKPTSTLEAGFDASYGRFNDLSLGGFVSGPLTDTLGVRVAARYEHRDPWQVSITRDARNGERDFLAGRLLFDWQPTDRLTATLNVNGWRNTSDTQVGQPRGYLPISPLPPTIPQTTAIRDALVAYPYPTRDSNRLADWDEGFSRERDDTFFQISGRLDYDLTDAIRVVSISTYSDLETLAPIDVDGTNVPSNQITQFGDVSSFAQELRIEGSSERLTWVVGGNYQRDKTRDFQTVRLRGSNAELAGIFFDGLDLLNEQNVRSFAGFASLEYEITDTLSLQGSARYTNENRDFAGCASDSGGANGFRIPLSLVGVNVGPGECFTILPDGSSGLYEDDLDEDNISWRGSLNWKVTPDVLIYSNITKGYKAGSFGTIPAVNFQQFNPVTQESVLAYEAGFKATDIADIIDINGAIFHYDYQDKQIQGFVVVPPFGALSTLVNIPEAYINGAELDLTLRPAEGLRITAAATYIQSKVSDVALVSSPFGETIDARGEAFPAQPRWQLQADAEYSFPISSGTTAFIGAGGSWRSSTVAAFGSSTGPQGTENFFDIKGYGLLDVRAGFETGDFRVQFFGRNVTNTQYWNNVTHIYDTYVRVTGFPVTYGVSLSARY